MADVHTIWRPVTVSVSVGHSAEPWADDGGRSADGWFAGRGSGVLVRGPVQAPAIAERLKSIAPKLRDWCILVNCMAGKLMNPPGKLAAIVMRMLQIDADIDLIMGSSCG